VTMQPDFKRSKRNRTQIDISSMGRLPPHSIEAEQGALGCCLTDPSEVIVNARSVLETESFYDLRHQAIWDCLVSMNEAMQMPDLITVQQRLKDAGQLEAVGGLTYLSGLLDSCPSAANFNYYAAILNEKHTLRRLLSAATGVASEIHQCEDTVEHLLASHLAEVESLTKVDTGKTQTAKQVIGRVIDFAELVFNKRAPKAIKSGLGKYDHMSGGLWPGEVVVIAARPSVGKTAMLMQILCDVAAHTPCGLFSVEMSADSIIQRVASGRAGVSVRDADTWTQGDFASFMRSCADVSRLQLHIDDTSAIPVQKVRAKAKEWVKKHGIKVLGIDYLQLVTTDNRREERQGQIAEISAGLKQVAKENGITVILLAQLNRESEKKGAGKPRISQLRESGAIEQDADVVGLLYRDTDEDDNKGELDRYASRPYTVTLDVGKNRSGPVFRIPFLFDPRKQQFAEDNKL